MKIKLFIFAFVLHLFAQAQTESVNLSFSMAHGHSNSKRSLLSHVNFNDNSFIYLDYPEQFFTIPWNTTISPIPSISLDLRFSGKTFTGGANFGFSFLQFNSTAQAMSSPYNQVKLTMEGKEFRFYYQPELGVKWGKFTMLANVMANIGFSKRYEASVIYQYNQKVHFSELGKGHDKTSDLALGYGFKVEYSLSNNFKIGTYFETNNIYTDKSSYFTNSYYYTLNKIGLLISYKLLERPAPEVKKRTKKNK